MPEPVKMAFERQVVVLPLSNILPIKRVPDTVKQAMRYKRIVASIAEVGIVEPLVVARRQEETRTLYAGRRPSTPRRAVGPR
jgi:ParB-like chromosome segregation protein Spo0J